MTKLIMSDEHRAMIQRGVDRTTPPPQVDYKAAYYSLLEKYDKDTEPFKPDYNTEAVLVEEMQRMGKRIDDLEMLLQVRAEQIVGLQDEIRNLTGEE